MNKSSSGDYRNYWLHILAWSLFIAYEVWVVWAMNGTLSTFLNYGVHYALLITWFYFAGDLVFPWTFKNLIFSIWKFPLAVAALFVIFTLANYWIDTLLIHFNLVGKKIEIALNSNYIAKILFRFVYIFGIAVAYFFIKNFIKQKNISLELEKQRLQLIIEDERTKRALSKAYNDFLKAQINPHFLFNTLDYVYHNISVQSPDAADAIMNLSEMMRYAVDSAEQEEFILLSAEMEQVEKLIRLYQLRKNQELNIIVDFNKEAGTLQFVPLILMTLVENIFKHGNVADKEIGVQIYVGIENDNLVMETLNGLNLNSKSDSSKAGLRNVTERLHFAYGEDARCSFEADEQVFRARVEVPVNTIQYESTGKAHLGLALY
ncbi:sensor histidine kinase [Pedobacter rhodius]|uniref:Histidine kinase n=1 Tax=Pedobacter rhodius TaxID=3004098 RepID=A0ABT4L0Y5_9SPHI|nr:histidine kinase [Pedobacter sp. SJ11]MCZ4224844.1 histidine kinase [Pedobacter sp. SJ11]